MSRTNNTRAHGHRTLVSLMAVAAMSLLVPTPADAHFILQTPPSWWTQLPNDGSPQKLGPCGNEVIAGTTAVAGVMTYTFAPGDPRTISITVDETVPHPGHYRVALAQTQGTLPLEPVVTAAGGDPCASAVIQTATTTPTVPAVLGDNLSPKVAGRTGVQTFSVTVPAGLTCTNCTLQVIEFMSSHPLNVPGGCFYHHCANVSIMNGAGGAAGGGAGGRGGAGTGGAGGRAGAGGVTGTGGSTTGSGGATGTGGSTTGSGGSTTGSGGSIGTGGTTAGSGGATIGGTGGSTTPNDGSTDGGTFSPAGSSGCACSLSSIRSPAGEAVFALFAGLGIVGLVRRRKR